MILVEFVMCIDIVCVIGGDLCVGCYWFVGIGKYMIY